MNFPAQFAVQHQTDGSEGRTSGQVLLTHRHQTSSLQPNHLPPPLRCSLTYNHSPIFDVYQIQLLVVHIALDIIWVK